MIYLYILISILKLIFFNLDIKDDAFTQDYFIKDANIVKADNWLQTILETLYDLFFYLLILFVICFIIGLPDNTPDDDGEMTFEKMVRFLERQRERERIIQELKKAEDERNGIFGDNQGTYSETGEEYRPYGSNGNNYSPFEE